MLFNKQLIKAIATVLILSICILAFPATASASADNSTVFTINEMHGKVFRHGVNQVVSQMSQFDTSISNVKVTHKTDNYSLVFNHEGITISIDFLVVAAKSNNKHHDHYIFSIQKNTSEKFSVINISFTTNANEHDILPVNSSMIGKAVLTVILSERESDDIYYWQGVTVCDDIVFSIQDSEAVIANANEYYYTNPTQTSHRITNDSFVSSNSSRAQVEYKRLKDIASPNSSTDPLEHNPYYDLGVSDNHFKNVTTDWVWHNPVTSSSGVILPIKYTTLSYVKYGSNVIYTYIMIIGYSWQRDDSILDYTAEDGQRYSKISAMIKVELFRTPHTVIYRPDANTFELMLGGEELTQINHPEIEIKKTSSNIRHVLVGRYAFSNGTKDNFLGLGALALSDILVRVLNSQYNLSIDLSPLKDFVSNVNSSVGSSDGYVPIEEYYSGYESQVAAYGEAFGSLALSLKGFLRTQGQYFGMRCWFATPYANRSSVRSVTYSWDLTPVIR